MMAPMVVLAKVDVSMALSQSKLPIATNDFVDGAVGTKKNLRGVHPFHDGSQVLKWVN